MPRPLKPPTSGRKKFFLPRKKTNVALLPVTRLFFLYITPSRSSRSPSCQSGLTSPDLLSPYRPLEKEQVEMGHFPPTSFSALSLSLSLLLYLFFRKDIYLYIYRARTIY